jgi:thioredoxin-like negative regulator of GroEL
MPVTATRFMRQGYRGGFIGLRTGYIEASMATVQKPGLIFFHSSVSGRCRRVEGFLAQVLQHRRNHETFRFYSVAREQRPDLVEKFGIEALPTLVVIEESSVRGRLEGPCGCREIESFLAPWLQ